MRAVRVLCVRGRVWCSVGLAQVLVPRQVDEGEGMSVHVCHVHAIRHYFASTL